MKLEILPLLAALLATAQASPVAVDQVEARDSINDCGDSSFQNQSSGGSPLITDCQVIVKNIAGGGTWACGTATRQIVSYGTCAFNCQAQVATTMGNQDVMDLINDSIKKFAWFDKVGAKGTVSCFPAPFYQPIAVNWGLYHT